MKATRSFGSTRLLVVMNDGSQLKADLKSPVEKIVQTFRDYGYPLEVE
jgi:hypothetical protein